MIPIELHCTSCTKARQLLYAHPGQRKDGHQSAKYTTGAFKWDGKTLKLAKMEAPLAFINQGSAVRPDGSKGRGLFAYLRNLAGVGEKGSQREVIANVFKCVQNRMVSGYLLRDILNKINGIHFSASEEMHTLSPL